MSQDESVTLCFACIQPIKTYMKNIFLFILVGLFFVSCTRSVDTDTAKVVIQLPQFTLASLKSEALKSKVTAMNETIDVEDRSEDAFSDITPTGYTNNAGDVPINCYLVGIGGPEAFLNVNFAGLKNTQGILIPSVQFGPFVGIKPAGASIELSVAPGDNRTVFVFGFHSVDISLCQDIQTAGEKTSKSNFSKPYLIGKSDPLKFVGGQEITVSVNLQTIANSTKLDDFYFPSFGDKISRPPATHIAVENNSFPQNIIRTNNTFTCEPLDIVLRSGENSGAGILPYPVQASIIKNSSVSTIYTDYLRCLNNSADTTVAIPSGQSSVRVWARARTFWGGGHVGRLLGVDARRRRYGTQEHLFLNSRTPPTCARRAHVGGVACSRRLRIVRLKIRVMTASLRPIPCRRWRRVGPQRA